MALVQTARKGSWFWWSENEKRIHLCWLIYIFFLLLVIINPFYTCAESGMEVREPSATCAEGQQEDLPVTQTAGHEVCHKPHHFTYQPAGLFIYLYWIWSHISAGRRRRRLLPSSDAERSRPPMSFETPHKCCVYTLQALNRYTDATNGAGVGSVLRKELVVMLGTNAVCLLLREPEIRHTGMECHLSTGRKLLVFFFPPLQTGYKEVRN